MRVTDYTLAAWTKSYGIAKHPDICVTHNAGFFSCCTIRLIFAILFWNEKGRLPQLDSSRQFAFYKSRHEDLTPFLFMDDGLNTKVNKAQVHVSDEPGEISFTDYSKFYFEDVNPFVSAYFTPSENVGNHVYQLIAKYNLDFENLCAVFFRGNDKVRETPDIPYSEFLNKAHEVLVKNPDVKFFLMPDETEFLEAFITEFPDNTIMFEETRHMSKKNSAIFFELPFDEKPLHARQFMSEVFIASKCKHLIIHSGNGSMWAVLYRGHNKNLHQILNGKWI